MKVPLEMMAENDIVHFKFDLLDLGIAICTQAVPPLFADNFDCQTLDEFIIGVLQDDLTDNTLHIHELGNDGYAARITDYHTLFGVQNDLVHRWLYPIVPEIASGKAPTQLGQAHRMFSRFLNIRIYEFLLFFYKVEVFYSDQKSQYNCLS